MGPRSEPSGALTSAPMSGPVLGSRASSPLFSPPRERIERANLTAFSAALEAAWGEAFPNYAALHDFSVREMEKFWRSLWTFCDVVGVPGERVLERPGEMPGARWFPDARLNFAENLLRRRDDAPALIFQNELGHASERTFAELHDDVSRLRQFLLQCGVSPGDRIAGFLPNLPDMRYWYRHGVHDVDTFADRVGEDRSIETRQGDLSLGVRSVLGPTVYH